MMTVERLLSDFTDFGDRRGVQVQCVERTLPSDVDVGHAHGLCTHSLNTFVRGNR